MKKIFGTLFLMFSSYTFINAQKHFPIDVISNYGKKIIFIHHDASYGFVLDFWDDFDF